MGLFHINKFCYSRMETLHITDSILKCEQVQSITPTPQFFRIEILNIFQLLISTNVKFCIISRSFVCVKIHNSTKYCENFLRRKMIKTRFTRSSHKILDSVQVLFSNRKIFHKVWVECQLSKWLSRMIFQKFSHPFVFTKSHWIFAGITFRQKTRWFLMTTYRQI